MKIICAPDSFKESLSAAEAADAMARGIKRAAADAQIDRCPIADGGEGTVDAMLAATGGQANVTQVRGPLGEPVSARWGLLGSTDAGPLTAVIEMAEASGLALVLPDQRDATRTTTFGTGMLIKAALDAGAERILMGIGGSATNDGGCGMAAALGVGFLDSDGAAMDGPPAEVSGGMLTRIDSIDMSGLDPRIAGVQITVACDVSNPLTGANGASAIYGPQKGASPQQVELLDGALQHLAGLFARGLGKDIEHLPGAGAAGGLGGGLVAFLGAGLQPGIDLVLEAVGFEKRATDCDLCLTGEGRMDGQSLSGKACLGVAQAAGMQGVDTIALVGSVGSQADRTLDAGLKAYHVISEGVSLEESMRRAAELLEQATFNVIRDAAAT